jgi:hypothetical protein
MQDGLLRFMRAHGQEPAPGQRPRMAGALGGAGAGLVSLPVLLGTGAVASVANALSTSGLITGAMYLAMAAVGGAVYGAVFQRAASDRRGGWLFGIGYGFLLWMVGPITLLQALLGRPLATGPAALGLLGAHLLYGLILGVLFRPLHGLVQGERNARPLRFPQARRVPR